MRRKKQSRSVLPWQAILVVLLVLVGGVFFLLPDRRELVDRYLDAGDPEKALAELERNPGDDPLAAALARLEAKRMIAETRKKPVYWEEAFRTGIEDFVSLGGPEILAAELAEMVPRVPDPKGVSEVFAEDLRSLDSSDLRSIQVLLANELLGRGEAAEAAELYRELLPDRGFEREDLEQLLALRRSANQPEEALADLLHYRELLPEDGETELFLAVEKARLLRSMDRVAEAFDLLFQLWQENPGVIESADFYREIRALSIAADRQKDVVPIVQARTALLPEDAAVFQDSLDLTLALASVEEAALLLEERRKQNTLTAEQERLLAQIREWTGEPGAAFDEYKRLALSGDSEAVQRLFELNEGLFRHLELADILENAPAAAIQEHLLQKARLQARIGEYEKAGLSYGLYLRNNPDRASVWAELADVALTIHNFPLALDAYRKALALDAPEEKRIRWFKDYAWILSLEGEYGEALAAYEEIFDQYGEEDVLPSIVSLASILGNRDLYRSTLKTIVTLNEGVSAYEDGVEKLLRQKEFGAERRWSDTLNEFRRSYAQILADDGMTDEAVDVIQQHRDLFDDPEVFEFYLSGLADAGRFEEGSRVLESSQFEGRLLRSPDVLRTAVWILEASGRLDRALVLAEDLVERFPGDPSAGLTYARLLAASGDTVQAAKLLDEYMESNPTPEVLLLASDTASEAGLYSDAEDYLLRYIAAKERPDSSDYSRLGDLRLAAGDPSGARESYRKALQALVREGGEAR